MTAEVRFDLSALWAKFCSANVTVLDSGSLLSMNTLQHSDTILREERLPPALDDRGEYIVTAPPFCFTEIVLANTDEECRK